MQLETLTEMVSLIEGHNQVFGHEIIEAWDARRRTIGYACVECNDAEHTWSISLTRAREPGSDVSPLLGSMEGREELLRRFNAHAGDRFFGSPDWNAEENLPPIDVLYPDLAELQQAAVEQGTIARPYVAPPDEDEDERQAR